MRKQLIINTHNLECKLIKTDYLVFIIKIFSYAGLPQRAMMFFTYMISTNLFCDYIA